MTHENASTRSISKERSLAMQIVEALHIRELSPDTSPAAKVWDCIEAEIIEHRKRHGEPTGEPAW